MRISSIGLIAAVSLGLGGCAYNGLGMGVGTGYGDDNYGYGYDNYSYGYGGGYSPYGYSPYGYNANGSPYGWHNGYYYPGSGNWVYDRDGRRREIRREEQAHFGRLAEVFSEGVRRKSNSTTNTSGGTAVTTTARVRAPARTQVIERSERPSATTSKRSMKGAKRIVRVRRDSKDD